MKNTLLMKYMKDNKSDTAWHVIIKRFSSFEFDRKINSKIGIDFLGKSIQKFENFKREVPQILCDNDIIEN